MSDIRKDPLSHTWVVVASERKKRPSDFIKQRITPPAKNNRACPFCNGEEISLSLKAPGNEAGEFGEKKRWLTRVLPNKYPALSPSPELVQIELDQVYHGLSGVGAHEIVVEGPEHEDTLATMSTKQIEAVLRTYKHRYTFWRRDPRIVYVLIFKNHGWLAGASLEHPHSQLVATPLIPPRVFEELRECREYYHLSNECLTCRILKTEEEAPNSRIIYENKTMVAFCPFASRFPFEILILPKRHESAFEKIEEEEIKDLAQAMSSIFSRLNKLLKDPPFNYMLHVSPLRTPGLLYFHWQIEVIPRLAQPAGFEWGSGIYINPVPPEEAAQELQTVKVQPQA